MKITEKIERECCQQQDMKRYYGHMFGGVKRFRLQFCTHCGQIWFSANDQGLPIIKRVVISVEAIKVSEAEPTETDN